MKKTLRRGLTLLLALMMALSVVSVQAFAEEGETPAGTPETTYTNPYVLGSKLQDSSDYQYKGYWGFATTPYESKFIIEKYGHTDYQMTDNACLFNLINPVKLKDERPVEASENDPWASIICYCVDVRIDINSNYQYRRINLEDATYFDRTAAERIRSIVNAGITAKTPAKVQEAVNASLNDEEKLSEVTAEEVLAAAQYAIWAVANEGEYSDPVVWNAYDPENWGGVWNHDHDTFTYQTPSGGEVSIRSRIAGENAQTDEAAAALAKHKANIETLVGYYMALPGTAANAAGQQVAVSNSSLKNIQVEYAQQSDGTWNAVVTFDVEATLGNGTDLTAAVTDGGRTATQAVTQKANTVTLTDLTSNSGDVKVELNGTQKVKGVFYFDAIGERASSQTLVGYDDSTLPVHAEATVGNVSVTKNWVGDTATDRPESITVKLLADGKDTGKTLTLNADNNWTGTFTNLVKSSNDPNETNDGPKEIAYTVKEVSVNGYTGTITGDAATGFIITNTKESTGGGGGGGGSDSMPETTSVKVNKVWSGDEAADRPGSITVKLLANGEDTGKTLTLSAANKWSGTFRNLDKKENGKTIEYTIVEVSVDGYTSAITGSASKGFTVTNTKTEKEEQPTSTETQYTVSAGKTLDGKPVTGFTFQLKDSTGAVVGTASAKSGHVTFPALTYTEAGTYTYTLTEVAGSNSNVIYDDSVYTVTVTVTGDEDGALTAACTGLLKNGAAVTGVTFANTYTGDEKFYEDETFELFEDEIPLGDVDHDADDEILDDMPLTDVPKTGDPSALWAAMAAFSGLGLCGLRWTRKREDA